MALGVDKASQTLLIRQRPDSMQTPLLMHQARFAVAPMMDWTDRHCRFFHRLLTRDALLYTEMVVADAVIHGDRERLLGFSDDEHPIALQIGGSEPEKLAKASEVATLWSYDEINLNVGCPSDRVQSGRFGACLMEEPGLVAECVRAMKAATDLPVTVKCRIGVDDQNPEEALDRLADAVLDVGCDAFWVHARKAWLQGLSPKENRDIPPLDYDRVYRLKQRLPDAWIGINGGIDTLDDAVDHLAQVDGVMLGRAAYHTPSLLQHVDQRLYGAETPVPDPVSVVRLMADYTDRHVAQGGRANQIARHMLGLFQGVPGARRWRQILSSESVLPGADGAVLLKALDAVALSQPARHSLSA